MLLAWLLLAQSVPPTTEALALAVIAALAKAFALQRAENKDLNDRVFNVVEKVEPVLHEVVGALKESTRAVERSGQGRDR